MPTMSNGSGERAFRGGSMRNDYHPRKAQGANYPLQARGGEPAEGSLSNERTIVAAAAVTETRRAQSTHFAHIAPRDDDVAGAPTRTFTFRWRGTWPGPCAGGSSRVARFNEIVLVDGRPAASPLGAFLSHSLIREDTLNINILNAYGGSGSLPGPRLSQGRLVKFAVSRASCADRRRLGRSQSARARSVDLAIDRRRRGLRRLECRCVSPRARSTRSDARGRWLVARFARKPAEYSFAPPTAVARTVTRSIFITLRPEIRRDYPLNLSISLSGGSETNQDSLSNGERSGNRPAPNPPPRRTAGTVVYRTAFGARRERPSPPDRGFTQRGCQACTALASASLCVLGVGLFGNAAQSGW
ncbi:hypothetical protein NP493_3110g00002 [Ridgeia piscesae]|uniref:Uncharacterized protein n=1 Tax=Ridgeia piscesae TaxID=27915 RepID=A0AAD9MYE1_RIDPI|nr:hypothetical protein NP493_3110g00002 [Ridgeia piscesae]